MRAALYSVAGGGTAVEGQWRCSGVHWLAVAVQRRCRGARVAGQWRCSGIQWRCSGVEWRAVECSGGEMAMQWRCSSYAVTAMALRY